MARDLAHAIAALPFAKTVQRGCHVPQGRVLAKPVADLPRDHELLLVVPDRLARLAEVGPGNAQITQRIALALPVAGAAAAFEGALQPADLLPGGEAEVEHVDAGVGEAEGEPGRVLARLQAACGPGLPGLDVGPLGVEEAQALEQLVAAGEVEVLGSAEHGHVVLGVPCRRLLACGFVQVTGSQLADEIVQPVAPGLALERQQGAFHEPVERLARVYLLGLPHRAGRVGQEACREHRELAPAGGKRRAVLLQRNDAEAQGGADVEAGARDFQMLQALTLAGEEVEIGANGKAGRAR